MALYCHKYNIFTTTFPSFYRRFHNLRAAMEASPNGDPLTIEVEDPQRLSGKRIVGVRELLKEYEEKLEDLVRREVRDETQD